MLEWTVRIRCNEHELRGSCSVLIFIGAVPDDPKKWTTSTSCVGIHDVFTGGAACDSASQADTEVEGFVPLNEGLLNQPGVNELTPGVVVPFLKSELHWRVQTMKGAEAQIQSLEVVVLATPISRVPGESIPIIGEPHFYHEITRGRSGGSRDA